MALTDFINFQNFMYLIAIIGVIGTFYFGFQSIKRKIPVYIKENFNFIRDFDISVPGLNISYSGEPIQNLSSTIVTFWNKGRERIEKSDITDAEPLQITAKEGVKIINAKITGITQIANAFSIGIIHDNKYLNFSFDFLSQNDGASIEIIHNGQTSDDIQIIGKIKDVGTPLDATKKSSKYDIERRGYWIYMGITLSIMILIMLLVPNMNILLFIMLIVIIAIISGLFVIKFLFPRMAPPKLMHIFHT